MIENKTIVISIAVILFILIILSQTFLSSSSSHNRKKGQDDIREDFPETATMNILYSDASGNLSSTNDGIKIGNVILKDAGDGTLRISNSNGYVDIGAKNTGWCHIYTDRPKFAFDKQLTDVSVWYNQEPWYRDYSYYNIDGKIRNRDTLDPLVPRGMIMLWSGASNAIPGGWTLCNGANGTPDLRDRFVVGAGSTYGVNGTGGNNDITLSVAQLPSHNHGMDYAGSHNHSITDSGHTHEYATPGRIRGSGNNACRSGGDISCPDLYSAPQTSNSTTGISVNNGGSHTHGIQYTGSGSSIDIRPKYYALCYIMKT